jgi:hypothetical protein
MKYLRENHMVLMDGNPFLNSGEVVANEASGSNSPLSSNLCYTNGYGVVINA